MRLNKKTPATLPIGAMLRTRRKELGLTLQQLAEKSGLSAPFLSQAERNQTVPSMVSLVSLAQALEVDISYFVSIPQDKEIVHRAISPIQIEMDTDVVYHQLSSDLPNRQMDAISMIIPPGFSFPVDQREGEDFLYVLKGELYAEAGNVKTVLRKGDSMHFDSRLAHTARNDSAEDVHLLYVGTPSMFKHQS